MSSDIKRHVEFLAALGINDAAHAKTYMAHLTNVYRYMKTLDCTKSCARPACFTRFTAPSAFKGSRCRSSVAAKSGT